MTHPTHESSAGSHVTHVSRTATIHLSAAPEQAFPLFTPIGEKLWSPEWNPQPRYPTSGEPEVGAVFVTEHHGEHQYEPTSVWVIAQYDPAQTLISYARVTPGVTAGLITVHCQPGDDEATLTNVTYTLTALGEAGEARLGAFTEAHYKQWMVEWETAINACLANMADQ